MDSIDILMVEATEGFDTEVDKGKQIYVVADVGMQMVYPKADEGLTDFLELCKLSNSKKMLCPRCSVVFDAQTSMKLEDTRVQDPMRRKGGN